MRETNPFVSDYFMQMSEDIRSKNMPKGAYNLLWAVLVCHRALREQAKLKGGILPRFTQEFVQDYIKKSGERFTKAMEDKNIGIKEAFSQIVRQNVVEFENMEKEFSDLIGSEDDTQWTEEQTLQYIPAIISIYRLFREGSRDPKNFQIDPSKKP